MPVRPSRLALGTALALATLAAAPAGAQVAGVNPFSVGVSAGGAVPTGETGDFLETGFSVDGIVAVRAPALPVSFRGEVGYTRFGIKDVEDVNFRVISGVVNAVYTFSAGPTAVVRPYLIGGVGLYNGRATGEGLDDEDVESQTKVGFNGGIGLEIPLSGITGFGEVRFTTVRAKGDGDNDLLFNVNFVPIRFGIRF